jgi:hypothetical protein
MQQDRIALDVRWGKGAVREAKRTDRLTPRENLAAGPLRRGQQDFEQQWVTLDIGPDSWLGSR